MEDNKIYDIEPALDGKLAAVVRSGKYTRWAADIDRATLRGVLWYVGEFAARSDGGGQFKTENWPDHHRAGIALRQHIALEFLGQVYRGRRLDEISINEVRKPLGEGMVTRTWDGQILDI